ncbi:MAG: hypothetical protein IPN85_10705 [Flavobacteriales bacterium]|nr:hypothetical protein [Flavobacteriales bacterium]
MRSLFVPLLLCLPLITEACTAFKVTRDGRTIVGNNEDAWSVNAQVRFEQGREGGYGAIYFGHYGGLPFRPMVDQLGMNEAGLVFDGLGVQTKEAAPIPGRKQLPFTELMPLVMRNCATVREAADLLRTYDLSWLTHAMLFLVDRNGDHLIVEADTMILGRDPSFALGNWRMSTCTDPDAIPIPRLQKGRALLAAGADTTLERGVEVLHSMIACRKKMGEGTLFSTLFDTEKGNVDLWFYHDFGTKVTFNLKEELTKGDRVIPMVSLFTPSSEYAALQRYITPFHQRWLFWTLVALVGMAVLAGLVCAVLFAVRVVRRLLGREARPLLPLVWLGLACVVFTVITGFLLTTEGVYYFGLGNVDPLLAWLPLLLVVLLALLGWSSRHVPQWRLAVGAVVFLPFLTLLGYWSLLWP